ncbi:hypothetical protein RP20_CCG001223 [Aedes albopictus]|nr:hypothetical protein RP20_CCG001223 [Aedes albopictus]
MQIVGKKQAISLTGTMEAIRNVKPPVQGKHTAKNTNLDMRVFEGFSIGNAHWQTEMRIVDGNNKTEICVWTEITITEKEM